MMRKNYVNLEENWSMNGTDLDEFRDVMKELSEKTHYLRTSTAEMSLLSFGYGAETSKKCVFLAIDSEVAKEFDDTSEFNPLKRSLSPSDPNYQVIRESINNAGFAIEINGIMYGFSENALASLFARAFINGDAMFAQSYSRDLFLMDCLYKAGIGERGHGKHDYRSGAKDQNCTLVYRECLVNGKPARKIFFVPTEKYAPVPLTILSDVAESLCDDDTLGRPDVRYWYTDHGVSEIVIVFPDVSEDIKTAYKLKDKILPGVLIRSSDTGKSCIEVKSVAFVRNNSSYITLETSKRKHFGDVNPEEIMDDANEVILRNIRLLPEVLVDLIGKPVYDGEPGARWESRNERAVEKLLNAAFKKIRFTPIIGKKREVILKEQLAAEIDPSIPYTGYDIAMMLMTIGDRIQEVSQVMRDEIATLCAKAPYVVKDIMDDDAAAEDLFLAPEA